MLLLALGSTADAFLMPQLDYISNLLRLSPDVAGVTFLALGNGAPDVFSMIAVATNDLDERMDLSFALADVIGGTLFIMTVVVGAVVIIAHSTAPGWTIGKLPFWRDSLMLLTAVTLVLKVAADGEISLREACLFLALHGVYILIVIFLPRVIKVCKRYAGGAADGGSGGGGGVLHPSQRASTNLLGASLLSDAPMAPAGANLLSAVPLGALEPIQIASPAAAGLPVSRASIEPLQMESPSVGASAASSSRQGGAMSAALSILGENTGEWFWTSSAAGGDAGRRRAERAPMAGLDPPGRDAGVVERVVYVLELPLFLLRWLTIPSSDGEWDRRRRIFSAVTPPVASVIFSFGPFLYGSVGGAASATLAATGIPMLLVLPACSLVISALIWFGSVDDRPPAWTPLLVLWGFIMTIVWLNLIANEMIALLESFGHILQVSTSILGLTVLAIGNSLGDLVADTAAARSGGRSAVRMALAACFGSPVIMNILSVGISFMLRMLRTETSTMSYKHVSALTRLGYNFFYVTMAMHLLVIPLHGYSAPRWYGVLLILVYATLIAMSILIESEVIDEHWLCVGFQWMFNTCNAGDDCGPDADPM